MSQLAPGKPAYLHVAIEMGEALAIADELGMRPLVAHCHLGLGKLYRGTGVGAKAQEHLTRVHDVPRDDMGFWLAQAETVH
jgi:hypothetical protein